MAASTKRSGITDLGVSMGCQALRRCWRNAVLGGFLDLCLLGVCTDMSSLESKTLRRDMSLRGTLVSGERGRRGTGAGSEEEGKVTALLIE